MPSRKQIIFFFLITLFLCSWHLDSYHNDNTMARAASIASLVDRGTLEITAIHEVTGDKSLVNGKYFSDKAPLPTFLVLPFHSAAVRLGLVREGDNGTLTNGLLRLGGFLCGSIPLALLIMLAWRDLKKREDVLPYNAALLATLPFFGSFLFVYSGSFYNHLLGALFSVLAARFMINKQFARVGLCGGAAFLCDPALMFFVGIWGVQTLLGRNWRGALMIAVGIIPTLMGAALHNHTVTGNPLVFPNAFAVNYGAMHQQYGFGTWQPQAFLGLLFSDYRGLLFYMPFLVIGLWTLSRSVKFPEFLRDPFMVPALLLIALFLTHATWWGGWTYGPRYLTGSAALLTFAILQRIRSGLVERSVLPVLIGIGVICALAAKATVLYDMPTDVQHPLSTLVLPKLLNGEFNGMQWPALLGLNTTITTLLYIPIFAFGLFLLVRIDRSTHASVPLP